MAALADGVIDRRVAREAARWLMHLSSGQASPDDTRACEQWRASNVMHERAWQRAQRVNDMLGSLPPELVHATLGRPGLKTRRLVLKSLAGLILGSPAAWAAWQGSQKAGLLADYRSAPGERRSVTLADGTAVSMNSGTALDVVDGGLLLRAGEIYVHAQSHVCVARTAQGRVSASQTRFGLRVHEEGCRLEIYQGQALVEPENGPALTVQAMQAAWFDRQKVLLLQAAVEAQPAWLRGVLHASDMSLADFAAELTRHRRGIVRCDPAVAALRVSGSFQLDNTDGVLRALPALLPVSVTRRTPYWVTIGPLET